MVRRTIKLSEARRNPEVNNADRKDSTAQALVPYVTKQRGDLPQYFVSFRGAEGKDNLKGIEKMDAPNMNPDFDTPLGLYAYPLVIDWFYKQKTGDNIIQDFMTTKDSSKFYNIYKYDVKAHVGLIVKNKEVEFVNTTLGEVKARFEKIMVGSPNISIFKDLSNIKTTLLGARRALAKLYRVHNPKLGEAHAHFKALKALGMDFILCLDDNFIHGNELYQIVFISKKGLSLVSQNQNRNTARKELGNDAELQNQYKEKSLGTVRGRLSQALVLWNRNTKYSAALYGVPTDIPHAYYFDSHKADVFGYKAIYTKIDPDKVQDPILLLSNDGKEVPLETLDYNTLEELSLLLKEDMAQREKKNEDLNDIITLAQLGQGNMISHAAGLFYLLSGPTRHIKFNATYTSPLGELTEAKADSNTLSVMVNGQWIKPPRDEAFYKSFYNAIAGTFGMKPLVVEDAPFTDPKNYTYFSGR